LDEEKKELSPAHRIWGRRKLDWEQLSWNSSWHRKHRPNTSGASKVLEIATKFNYAWHTWLGSGIDIAN